MHLSLGGQLSLPFSNNRVSRAGMGPYISNAVDNGAPASEGWTLNTQQVRTPHPLFDTCKLPVPCV